MMRVNFGDYYLNEGSSCCAIPGVSLLPEMEGFSPLSSFSFFLRILWSLDVSKAGLRPSGWWGLRVPILSEIGWVSSFLFRGVLQARLPCVLADTPLQFLFLPTNVPPFFLFYIQHLVCTNPSFFPYSSCFFFLYQTFSTTPKPRHPICGRNKEFFIRQHMTFQCLPFSPFLSRVCPQTSFLTLSFNATAIRSAFPWISWRRTLQTWPDVTSSLPIVSQYFVMWEVPLWSVTVLPQNRRLLHFASSSFSPVPFWCPVPFLTWGSFQLPLANIALVTKGPFS